MRLLIAFSVLVFSVVSQPCDEETFYKKDNKCCKMCEPGTKMKQNTDCYDPVCEECADGEYQDVYTFNSQCNLQRFCDPNLNLQAETRSKTQASKCVCIPDHHCAGTECGSCVRNTQCKPGEKISKLATQTSDTVCEPCPNGTFVDDESASSCKPWTQCSSGSKEVLPGSSTSDRVCEAQNQKFAIVVPVVVVVLLLLVVGALAYMFYRKGKTGSAFFMQKLWPGTFGGVEHPQQPAEDNGYVENGQPAQPINQPQEDTEDFLKHDNSLAPGVTENGMPVIQDQSKSLLLSEAETEPGSFSDYL